MKKLGIFTLLLFASVGVFSQETTNRTKMTFSAQFDTLRQVGYTYIFGTDNPSETSNAISFGILEFTDAKVGPVQNCVYETLFDNAEIQSVKLSTDKKTNSKQLYDYASLTLGTDYKFLPITDYKKG